MRVIWKIAIMFRRKQAKLLAIANVHAISTTYYLCGMNGCKYEGKDRSAVQRHKAAIHDIDVTYYLCDIENCNYKAKVAGSLKIHKAVIHDIDVTYYFCNVDGCEYKRQRMPVPLGYIKLTFTIFFLM